MGIIDNKKTVIAFFDTSVIDPMKNSIYSFVKILKKNVEQKKLKLITTQVVVNEVYSHIEDDICLECNNIEKSLNSRSFSLLNADSNMEKIHKLNESKKFIEMSKQKFNEILNDLKVEILNEKNISVTKLMEMYFNAIPPFGSKKEKKSEFPDAISYLTIKECIPPCKIHIVASDGDWKSVPEVDPSFVYHRTINEFLDYMNQSDELYLPVRKYLEQSEIDETISNLFENDINEHNFEYCSEIYYDYLNYDCEDIEIFAVNTIDCLVDGFEDIYKVSENDSEKDIYIAQVIVNCIVDVELKYKVLDEDNSPWDQEDGKYIYKSYMDQIKKFTTCIPAKVNVKCVKNNENNYTFNIDSCNLLK